MFKQIPNTDYYFVQKLQTCLGSLNETQKKHLETAIKRDGFRGKLIGYKVDDKIVLIDGIHRAKILSKLKIDSHQHLDLRELPNKVKDVETFLVRKGIEINKSNKYGRKLSNKTLVQNVFPLFKETHHKGDKFKAFSVWLKENYNLKLKPTTVENYVRNKEQNTRTQQIQDKLTNVGIDKALIYDKLKELIDQVGKDILPLLETVLQVVTDYKESTLTVLQLTHSSSFQLFVTLVTQYGDKVDNKLQTLLRT